jgi:hypothetical protein
VTRGGYIFAQIAVTAALSLVLSFAIPVFVDRHAYAKAFMEYERNPSVENKTVYEREGTINRQIAIRTQLAVAGFMFVFLNGACFLVKYLQRTPAAG